MAYNDIRERTPCRFRDGFTQQEFENLALKLGRRIKRITDVWVDGAVVYCTVESQSHISEWAFAVDFNNWGHVTGTFWLDSDNPDSSIPHNFGMTLSGWIQDELNQKDVYIKDMSDAVDRHANLSQLINHGYYSALGILRSIGNRAVGNNTQISVSYSDEDLRGEHLYPVFAQLMDNGFETISTRAIKDVDDYSSHYEYEVAEVSILNTSLFEKGTCFDRFSHVIITYHAKKEIIIPFRVGSLIRQNYLAAGDRLQELGFTKIYEKEIADLAIGLLVKDGSTEKITVEDDNGVESVIQNGKAYLYDIPITVYYHTIMRF